MLINMIIGLVIFGSIAVVALRVLSRSGVTFPQIPVFNTLFKNTNINNGFLVSQKETATVFGVSLLFRLTVFFISAFAVFIMSNREFSFDGLIESYMQWDANNYYRIAKGGYSYYVENGAYTTLAFFPLYPFMVGLLNVFFNNLTVSGLVISALLYSGACTYLYKLMSFDYNKRTSVRAIVFISVFPHSFFFGTMMNESLLFFTAAACLYYIRRHAWVKVGVFGALAAMSRMAGILLIIPAAVEWLENYRIIKLLRKKYFGRVWKLFYKKAIWIFLMFLGAFVYLLCNYQTTGEWFKFLEYQQAIWHNTPVFFGECLSLILNRVTTERGFTLFALWLPQLIAIVFVVSLLVYGIRKTRSMYTSFLAVYIIINMGMSWPLSIGRYITCAIPAFMILAEFSERHKWTEQIITAAMAIAFGVFFTAYFMARQIM